MTARRLRTVFFGSSAFAVPSLVALRERHELVAVCSQPDKPAGRGLELRPTPVSAAAREANVDVLAPARLDAAFVERLRALRPELIAVAAYGKILPGALLELPTLASLNVHPSLLPLYRGATPIQSALREGRERTGVTVFWMTPRMDAGDIALARAEPIGPRDDYGSLHDRLAHVGAQLLDEAAGSLGAGRLGRTPQREEDATYCKPLGKDDLRLRLDVPAKQAIDQIRSLSPRPGAWTLVDGRRIKVLEAEVVVAEVVATAVAGPAGSDTTRGPVIAAADGAIRLLRVVPEGKPAMSGAEFAKASAARR